jgi:hypothetical protein
MQPYFVRHFRKWQVFYRFRKAHPHPGDPDQIVALFWVIGTLRTAQ